ncbi:MAG: carbohydrate kinase family protein [Erysipelotrichaceae bacterium]|nr:carbohydrate kinase family protein [Erysipelotrichaceae bacterium]
MNDIVIVGTTIIDRIMSLKSPFNEYGCNKVNITEFHGGSMRNVAENCANLALSVDFISKFGNDQYALNMIDHLNKLNVNVYGPTIDLSTPIFIKVHGDKSLMFATTTPDFYLTIDDNIPVSALRNHRFGITDNTDPAFLSYLLKHGINTEWIVSAWIPETTFFDKITGIVLNRHEFKSHFGDVDIAKQLLSLHDQGLKWIVVTLDDEGCVYCYDSNIVWINTEKKKGHPLGCGDAFISGLIFGLSQDWYFSIAVKFANHLAQQTLNTIGPVTSNLALIKDTFDQSL